MKGEVDARWGRAVDVYVIRCPMHRFIREERVSTKRLLQPKNNNIPITHKIPTSCLCSLCRTFLDIRSLLDSVLVAM